MGNFTLGFDEEEPVKPVAREKREPLRAEKTVTPRSRASKVRDESGRFKPATAATTKTGDASGEEDEL
jgi:hypothetical protein